MTSYAAAPRLPRAERDDFSAEQASIWDHVVETRKLAFMPNMFAVMGQSPEALRAVASVGEHVRWHSALDNDLREMIICTVSQAVGNVFEWDHHIHKVPERFRAVVGTPAMETEPHPSGRRSASPASWQAVKTWTTRWWPSCARSSAMPGSSIWW